MHAQRPRQSGPRVTRGVRLHLLSSSKGESHDPNNGDGKLIPTHPAQEPRRPRWMALPPVRRGSNVHVPWVVLLYGPLFLAVFILSIVSMAQRRIAAGVILLVVTLAVPTVTWIDLAAVPRLVQRALRRPGRSCQSGPGRAGKKQFAPDAWSENGRGIAGQRAGIRRISR